MGHIWFKFPDIYSNEISVNPVRSDVPYMVQNFQIFYF